jgi:hypothetical protein
MSFGSRQPPQPARIEILDSTNKVVRTLTLRRARDSTAQRGFATTRRASSRCERRRLTTHI